MNQDGDLAAQVEPRGTYAPQPARLELGNHRGLGNTPQARTREDGVLDGLDPAEFDGHLREFEFALHGALEDRSRSGTFFAQHPGGLGEVAGAGGARRERVMGIGNNRQLVFAPREGREVAMVHQSLDPTRIALKLEQGFHYLIGVSHGHMELIMPMAAHESRKDGRQHVVSRRQAGADADVHRPMRSRAFDVEHPVENLRGGGQKLAARRVQDDAAAVAVEEFAFEQVLELRQGLAGGGLGEPDLAGRAGDGLLLADGTEDFELANRDAHTERRNSRSHRLIDPTEQGYRNYQFPLFRRHTLPCGLIALPKKSRGFAAGLGLCLLVALAVWYAARLPWDQKVQLSPLTLAILAGMAVGNTVNGGVLSRLHPGIKFSQQRLLRLGIVLYGIRLTVHDLFRLGPRALALDVAVIACVLLLGYWFGTRVLGMDADTALLVSAGSAICGAAAVLATDRVIDSESHKVGVAVATVVVFGTIAMFLYPLLYPHTGFTERQFGIYTGATVHEVAQVVAVGRAVGQMASDTAVIAKMLRVLLLAPVLLLVGRLRGGTAAGRRPIAFPWFVVWFVGVIALQSLYTPTAVVRSGLIDLDTVLLSGAMFALGLGTRWDQLRKAGTRPLLLAAALFGGLVGGGFLLTSVLVP